MTGTFPEPKEAPVTVAGPTVPGTALREDQVLPDVALEEVASGTAWRPSLLRQRSAFVVVFVHDACSDCERLLAALAERGDDLAWAETAVRVVAPEPTEAPFPVVLDPKGTARSRWLGADGVVPTLLLADRYAALSAAYPGPDHDVDVDDVVATVCHLAIQCAECSV